MKQKDPRLVGAKVARVLEVVLDVLRDDVPSTQKFEALTNLSQAPWACCTYVIDDEPYDIIRLGKPGGVFNPLYFRQEARRMSIYYLNGQGMQRQLKQEAAISFLEEILRYRRNKIMTLCPSTTQPIKR